MRYELQNKPQATTRIVCCDIVNEERDKENKVITEYSETPNGLNAWPINLILIDTESLNTSAFSKDLMVEVSVKLSVEEVDKAVQEKVTEYLETINK